MSQCRRSRYCFLVAALVIGTATSTFALPPTRTVALKGQSAPATAPGVTFDMVTSATIDRFGRTTFMSNLVGPGIDATNDKAIYSEDAGGLTIVARKGALAPGLLGGETFLDFFTTRRSADGRTAFTGRLTGPGVNGTNDIG